MLCSDFGCGPPNWPTPRLLRPIGPQLHPRGAQGSPQAGQDGESPGRGQEKEQNQDENPHHQLFQGKA